MASDIYLWRTTPGQVGGSRRHVAMLTIRDVDYNGASVQGDPCLNIDVSPTPGDPIMVRTPNGDQPATLTWVSMDAQIWTTHIPRQRLGRAVISPEAMPGINDTQRSPWPWHWLIRAKDVELVERLRAIQPDSPLQLSAEVEGLVKVTLGETGQILDIITLRGESTGNIVLEMPKWDRMMTRLGFSVKSPALGFTDRAAAEHPSWQLAMQVTERAQTHYRNGEDYDALRDCLAGLEALVTAPYHVASWRPLLRELPGQKADGIAQLLSGLATYCNKIGHHRDRQRRDADGNLPAQPLDHWEADLIIGAAQYLLAYAIRLRVTGQLTTPTPDNQSTRASQAEGSGPADGGLAPSSHAASSPPT